MARHVCNVAGSALKAGTRSCECGLYDWYIACSKARSLASRPLEGGRADGDLDDQCCSEGIKLIEVPRPLAQINIATSSGQLRISSAIKMSILLVCLETILLIESLGMLHLLAAASLTHCFW